MFYGQPTNTSGVGHTPKISITPSELISETQIPQFSTQAGLENITIDEAENSSGRTKRAIFTIEEDNLLVQSWVNVSKDPIVGVDQKAHSFCLRVKEGYNDYRKELEEKRVTQLKSRWHKINNAVQKFVGCYKQAVTKHKSGNSENDIMAHAHTIFRHDENIDFKFVHVWKLLKDEPKWRNDSIDVPTSFESQPTSPLVRPMGQKAAKRKAKEKVTEASSSNNNLAGIEDMLRERNAATMRVAEVKEREVKAKEDDTSYKLYEILLKDTSEMSERQLQDHELYCQFIRRRLGM